MTQERITRQDIDEIKRQHILANLLYTPQEVALVLSCSVRTVFNRVEEGRLDSVGSGNGTRITALSVENFRIKNNY